MNIVDPVNKFEKVVYAALMAILIIVLVVSLYDLVIAVYNGLITMTTTEIVNGVTLRPQFLDANEFIGLLGGFLLVLIAVELLDTIKAYFTENTIHVEIVILLAIIAVARKVILLNTSNPSSIAFDMELVGIGILVAGLGAGYYLIKKGGITITRKPQPPE
jgi:uncharacterized membrane protein (DUF373 family)